MPDWNLVFNDLCYLVACLIRRASISLAVLESTRAAASTELERPAVVIPEAKLLMAK